MISSTLTIFLLFSLVLVIGVGGVLGFKFAQKRKKKKLNQTGPIIAPPMYTKLEKNWAKEDSTRKPITAIPLPDKPAKREVEQATNNFWLPTVETPEKYYFKQPLNMQE